MNSKQRAELLLPEPLLLDVLKEFRDSGLLKPRSSSTLPRVR
jgi:hypothetical protein